MMSTIFGASDEPRGARVFRIRGVDVLLDFSWYVIAVLLVISFTASYVNVGVGDGAAFFAGVATAALLFLSILGHELGHAEIARRFGIATRSVKLHLLGGSARLARNPRTPTEEFMISGAGPGASLLIALALFLPSLVIGGVPGLVLRWTAVMNLVLGIFNLLPAFPLDGGRMLRAWFWDRSRDLSAATRRTVGVGSVVGTVFFVLAAVSLFTHGFLTALMLAATGLFVKAAGRLEIFRAQMQQGGTSLFEILQRGGLGGLGGGPASRPPRESAGTRTVILQDGTEVRLDE